MSNCSRCGAVLPAGAAFCSGCGERVDSKGPLPFCAQCGAEIPNGANFCSSCGAPRAGSAPNPSPNPARPTTGARVSDCLVWSIVSTIVFFPMGLGALIFSLLSRNAAGKGDLSDAMGFAEGARVWNIVLWVIALGGLLVAGFFLILMAIFGVIITA